MANETTIERFEKYNPHLSIVDVDGDGNVNAGDQAIIDYSGEVLEFEDDRFQEARKRAVNADYSSAHIFSEHRGKAAAGVAASIGGIVVPLFRTVFHGGLGNIWDGEARVLGIDLVPDVITNFTEKYLKTNTLFGNPDDARVWTRVENSWSYWMDVAGTLRRDSSPPFVHADFIRGD